MSSVLEVERKNARRAEKEKISHGGGRGRSAEGTEKRNPRAQPGMAVPQEERVEIAFASDYWERSNLAGVPPLRGRRANCGAEEKAGHSGRDDGSGILVTMKRKMFVIGWNYERQICSGIGADALHYE
jgi:hypothetical protein